MKIRTYTGHFARIGPHIVMIDGTPDHAGWYGHAGGTAAGQFTFRSRPSQYGARSLNFCSFPVAVRLSSSRNSTDVGAL